jgi:hypothetical protein
MISRFLVWEKNFIQNFGGKYFGKRPLRRPERRRKNNMNVALKEG